MATHGTYNPVTVSQMVFVSADTEDLQVHTHEARILSLFYTVGLKGAVWENIGRSSLTVQISVLERISHIRQWGADCTLWLFISKRKQTVREKERERDFWANWDTMSVKSGKLAEWKKPHEPRQEYKPVTLGENIYCITNKSNESRTV